jgi:SAM-dependent methyltransferase
MFAMNSRSELDSLVAMGRAAKGLGARDMEHLDNLAAAYNYVRITDLICEYCHRTGPQRQPILDWGCGYGQVSWLLRSRGVEAVSYDIEERPLRRCIPGLDSLSIDCGNSPIRLPYEGNRFGSVLSVGVLEHVSDFEASVAEVSRVLRLGGLLFIFMLPNRYSWAEQVADRRGISAHPDKFTFKSAAALLQRHGFEVEKKWRRHVLPRNLTGLNPRVKRIYGRAYRAIESVDHVLSAVPPVCYLSGVVEMIARKR